MAIDIVGLFETIKSRTWQWKIARTFDPQLNLPSAIPVGDAGDGMLRGHAFHFKMMALINQATRQFVAWTAHPPAPFFPRRRG